MLALAFKNRTTHAARWVRSANSVGPPPIRCLIDSSYTKAAVSMAESEPFCFGFISQGRLRAVPAEEPDGFVYMTPGVSISQASVVCDLPPLVPAITKLGVVATKPGVPLYTKQI